MKLKIVNFKKFLRSIIIFALIVLGTLFIIGKSTLSHSDINYKTLAISNGDTLWTIASEEQKYNEYYSKKDIRYIIDDLKQLNNKNNCDLQIGEELIIPIY